MNRLLARQPSRRIAGAKSRGANGNGSASQLRALASVDDQIASLLESVTAELSMGQPPAGVASSGRASAIRGSDTPRLRSYVRSDLDGYSWSILPRILLYVALAVVIGILSVEIANLAS